MFLKHETQVQKYKNQTTERLQKAAHMVSPSRDKTENNLLYL